MRTAEFESRAAGPMRGRSVTHGGGPGRRRRRIGGQRFRGGGGVGKSAETVGEALRLGGAGHGERSLPARRLCACWRLGCTLARWLAFDVTFLCVLFASFIESCRPGGMVLNQYSVKDENILRNRVRNCAWIGGDLERRW